MDRRHSSSCSMHIPLDTVPRVVMYFEGPNHIKGVLRFTSAHFLSSISSRSIFA